MSDSYIPENPRTPKPLTFSKNRLRGAKNRSNTSPVAKKNSEKTTFFFQKLCICAKKKLHICTFFCFVLKTLKYMKCFWIFYRSLYNTYLKGLLKKFEKKSCTYAKIKKKLFFRKFFLPTGLDFERILAPRSQFFEKVNGLGVFGFSGIYEFSKKPDSISIFDPKK